MQNKRALAKQFSQMQQDFDYSEDSPDDQSSIQKRDTVLSRFMPTSRRLVQFSDGNVADPNAKIVYIDGAFDLFHVGHIEILKVWPDLLAAHDVLMSQSAQVAALQCCQAFLQHGMLTVAHTP